MARLPTVHARPSEERSRYNLFRDVFTSDWQRMVRISRLPSVLPPIFRQVIIHAEAVVVSHNGSSNSSSSRINSSARSRQSADQPRRQLPVTTTREPTPNVRDRKSVV